MPGILEDKAIIITGTATGIGRAAATLFAANGARLMLADMNEAGAQTTIAEITGSGGEADFIRTDVSDEAQVRAMMERAVARFGRLDGAFNNAGIGYPHRRMHELELSDWDHAIGVNLTGVFLCMKHEIAAMLETGSGAIVNTGSVASMVGLPLAAGYNAAKHGVMGLTRNAALDYGPDGIRVNAVLPGGTVTPMVEKQRATRKPAQPGGDDKSFLKRMADPVEIAAAACWLLSDQSSFVTGHGLSADGGFVAG